MWKKTILPCLIALFIGLVGGFGLGLAVSAAGDSSGTSGGESESQGAINDYLAGKQRIESLYQRAETGSGNIEHAATGIGNSTDRIDQLLDEMEEIIRADNGR